MSTVTAAGSKLSQKDSAMQSRKNSKAGVGGQQTPSSKTGQRSGQGVSRENSKERTASHAGASAAINQDKKLEDGSKLPTPSNIVGAPPLNMTFEQDAVAASHGGMLLKTPTAQQESPQAPYTLQQQQTQDGQSDLKQAKGRTTIPTSNDLVARQLNFNNNTGGNSGSKSAKQRGANPHMNAAPSTSTQQMLSQHEQQDFIDNQLPGDRLKGSRNELQATKTGNLPAGKNSFTPMTINQRQNSQQLSGVARNYSANGREATPFQIKSSFTTTHNNRGGGSNMLHLGFADDGSSNTTPFGNKTANRSSTMGKSASCLYFSMRKYSTGQQLQQRSIISQLHPKEQKLSLDYFLGTQRRQETQHKQEFKDSLANILDVILSGGNQTTRVPNGEEIVSNLKVIFFEHSIFVEGGTMGSTIQPVNQNMMTLYQFHQFLKRYQFVFDHRQSHQYEMIFLEVSNKQMKKVDFKQFATVLARMAHKIYSDEFNATQRSGESQIDTLDSFLKFVNDFLFLTDGSQVTKPPLKKHEESKLEWRDNSPQARAAIDQPLASPVNAPVDNEFERYRVEYDSSDAKKVMLKERKLLDSIFSGYAKASKRGVKIIALRQYKWMMRDLSIIPHITSEYKCTQLFKFLDAAKKVQKDYPEEILTFDVFPLSMYIVFSLILEDQTDIKQKSLFILKWLKEHSKDKLAGVHACREDRRIQFTNHKLAGKKLF